MSFWDDLFAKQPGGSVVGNILRRAGAGIAPGILGTGKHLVPDENRQYIVDKLDEVGVNNVNGKFNLNDYVELPEVKIGMTQKANWLLIGGIALIAGILLFKKK